MAWHLFNTKQYIFLFPISCTARPSNKEDNTIPIIVVLVLSLAITYKDTRGQGKVKIWP